MKQNLTRKLISMALSLSLLFNGSIAFADVAGSTEQASQPNTGIVATLGESLPAPRSLSGTDWAIDADGNLTISTQDGMTDWVANGYTANKTTVKTATIDEAVTEIPDSAFEYCAALVSVTANGATDIGEDAFSYCATLTSASFPEATTIGSYSFSSCEALERADFPEATTIGNDAFNSCEALERADFPAATTIDFKAFFLCGNLTSVSLPEATSIGDSAFFYCGNLTSVSFPKMTSIGSGAFTLCLSLTALSLPAVPPSVGSNAFDSCPSPRGLSIVGTDGTALTGADFIAAQAAYKAVDDSAMSGEAAGNDTWYGWTLPVDKGWTIDRSGNLTISSDDGMTDWKANGYKANYSTIKTVTIADAVTAIADYAFLNCKKLTTVSGGGQVSSIGSHAFGFCEALTAVSFPEATTIGGNAFEGCKALERADFPAVTTIGEAAFYDCVALKIISFPKATSIIEFAFFSCEALERADFPEVAIIGDSAFNYCVALTSASFPKVTTIGEAAFYNCQKLTTLSLPAAPPSVTNANAFTGCPSPRALKLVDENGNPLTGTDLTAAQAAYKAVDDRAMSGEAAGNDTWYGFTITATPTVTTVAVTPKTANIQQGGTQQFTATVTGTNSPAQTVAWSVAGAAKTGTAINANGLLTVAADETAAALTVTATSTVDTGKSDTATVTVTVTPVKKYTLTVTNGTGGGDYEAGASVTASANAAPSNQHFKEWTAAGLTGVTLNSNPLTFLMPTGAVTLTAVYEADPPAVTADKAGLIAAIANAKSIMANTVVSVWNGADVSTSAYWVLPDIMSAAKAALAEAEAALAKADATQAEVDNAAVNLGAKVNIDFKNAKKPGTKSGGTSSGSSGSSGNSGGGSTPVPTSAPKRTEPVTGISDTTAAVDKNGNTTATVTEKNIADAVKAAKSAANKKGVNAGEITAVINVSASANSNPNTVTVNLPKAVQKQVISGKIGNIAVVIDKPDISIGMNLATITEMNRQANADIQLSATRVDAAKLSTEAKNVIGNRPAFDLRATYGGGVKRIVSLGSGTMTVKIPYTLQKGEVADGLFAVYVDKNGKVTYITNSSYDTKNKVMRLDTNHLSVYGIGYKAPESTADISGETTRKTATAGAAADAALPTDNKKHTPYTVQTGDSFWRIANKLGCTMDELEELNGQSRYVNLYTGEVLKVPQR